MHFLQFNEDKTEIFLFENKEGETVRSGWSDVSLLTVFRHGLNRELQTELACRGDVTDLEQCILTTISFLGHVLGVGTIQMEVQKTQAIQQWPETQECQGPSTIPRLCKLLPAIHSQQASNYGLTRSVRLQKTCSVRPPFYSYQTRHCLLKSK